MNSRIVRKVILLSAGALAVLLLIGFGYLVEVRTFRASVSGQVTDMQGRPVAGASVAYCVPNPPDDSIAYDMSTQTDSDGRYAMRLPDLRLGLDASPDYRRRIRISADGYVPVSTYATLDKGFNPDRNYVLIAGSE